MKIEQAVQVLQEFTKSNPTGTIANIEAMLPGVMGQTCTLAIDECGASSQALGAAALVKQLAGQINVVIHALGILRCLPHILQPDEKITLLSLGAGNTGRQFDLVTDRQIAEFKFIRWRGGAEAIRQDSLFKDFYSLAESSIEKQKNLYVLGTQHPLAFFSGSRVLTSVCSRNRSLLDKLQADYPNAVTVQDYYALRKDAVSLIDVSDWLPELALQDDGS